MEKPNHSLKISNNFLNLWVKSLSEITDAPKIFLTFSGIALLSGVLNKFHFKWPQETHLNLYILLLAPSTFYRKSTCAHFVSAYLKNCNPNLKLPESFTVEALYQIMNEQHRGLIIWPDLIQVKEFLMAKNYNKGLSAFLSEIYDYEDTWERRTVRGGKIIVEEPVISILAAGITNWFTKNLNPLDFQGGLWTRFLFVPAPEMERKYTLPKSFIFDPKILKRLRVLNNLEAGEVDLSQIKPLILEWGAKHQEETQQLDIEIMSRMYQRLEVMLFKLAAILQISHNRKMIITPETFKEAVKVIEYLKGLLPNFFEKEIHFDESNKAQATILRFIKRKGRALKKEILQGTKIPKKLADPALKQLIEEEEIKPIEIPTSSRGGRPGIAYEYMGEDKR